MATCLENRENVREFDSRQGRVEIFTKIQGNIKDVLGKPCQGELHIANFMFGDVAVFCSIYAFVFIILLNMMWVTAAV